MQGVMNMPQPVKIGKKTRMSYAKIKEVAQMPHLLEIQNNSYKWFIEEGLKEVFEDISPINDYAGNLVLEFIDYSLSDSPKYGQEECKERDVTYAAPLRVKARLVNKETGEVKEQEVFMGDFPLMTEKGTFIYNGAERVVVTQLVRSPGPYYAVTTDKSNNSLYSTTIIPNRGAWLEYETDSNEIISVRVDRTRKQPVTTLLRAFGFGTDEEIIELFGEDDRLLKTLERDTTNNYEEGLKEIYKKLRPGEPPTVESASLCWIHYFLIRRDMTLRRWADINTTKSWVFPTESPAAKRQRISSILTRVNFSRRRTRLFPEKPLYRSKMPASFSYGYTICMRTARKSRLSEIIS